MTTLIAVYNSEGCVGRCDAKCYDATGMDCQCVCGGENHGAGLAKAAANTAEMAESWIAEYCKQHDIKPTKSVVKTVGFQPALAGM